MSVVSSRQYQAARFAGGSTAGTIASRHCPLDQLSLTAISSIEPYLTGYADFLRRISRQGRNA